MNRAVQQAVQHWAYVAPLLKAPRNEQEYNVLTQSLDELLAMTGDDDNHPLSELVDRIGDLISAYDREHYPISEVEPREALRYLMQEHGLSQSDLPEIGPQPIVSDILAGKRSLNARQIKALSLRFGVKAEAFL